MLNGCRYYRPPTLPDALAALADDPRARALAGGTDLMSEMAEGIAQPTLLVDLGALDALRHIASTPTGGLAVGARVTLTDLWRNADLAQRYPVLAQAARSVGTAQLRNQGTLGGNLCQRPRCWYYRSPLFQCLKKGGESCFAATGENRYHAVFGGEPCFIVHPSDCAPALTALGARLIVESPEGQVECGLEDLFVLPRQDPTREHRLQPGELITQVVLSPADRWTHSAYLKQRERAWDFALVSVAAALRLENGACREARIALGGVAPVPWRVSGAEDALTGRPFGADAIRRAADRAIEGAQPLEGNAFKIPLIRTLVRRCLSAFLN